jgi:hypothetical protein
VDKVSITITTDKPVKIKVEPSGKSAAEKDGLAKLLRDVKGGSGHVVKISQAISDSGIDREWLWRRLGCSRSELVKILNGERAASYGIAKGFLEVLGYALVVAAINWRLTRYAGI